MVHNPRRTLLLGTAAAMQLGWLSGCATSPEAAHEATNGRNYRLANRLSWGATDVELERVRTLGAAAYIEQQLRAAAGPMPAAAQAQIDALRVSQHSPLALWTDVDAARKRGEALPTQEERKAAQDAFQQALGQLARESGTRHLLRALYSPNQLLEQMQWFWFNHFNVHQFKNNLRFMLADYEERALRPHALGRFRDLLGAATRHPAMLRYLDNEQNAAGRINENLARELLELHTLGVDGGYSQRDVQELARVLTGHGLNLGDRKPNVRTEHAALYSRDGLYEFNPARHDFGDKTLLGRSVRGQGAAELDTVFDVLAAHPATARFVCGELVRHFLGDDPPAALAARMAAAWGPSGDIAAVLAVLMHAPEFTAAQTSKFKDPMHFVVSAVRACYGPRVVLNCAPMLAWLNRLGQGLYNRPTPDGYPSTAAAWSSSGQLSTRLEIARTLGGGSAGLFKLEGAAAREEPAFPQLARPIYWQVLRPLLAAPTRQALEMAASPQDWNALYLSAPEFMYS
jgi:uncharacterized protein (DUF1800 family)